MKDRTETVVFRSFYEKGFALPAGAFFRELLFFYGIEVTHLNLNSITRIAIFIHLCEAYLGIAPHFNLWRVLYHLKGYPSNACHSIVGSAAFCLCQGHSYPSLDLRDSNKGGTRSGSWCRTQLLDCLLALAMYRSIACAGRSCRLRRRWSR